MMHRLHMPPCYMLHHSCASVLLFRGLILCLIQGASLKQQVQSRLLKDSVAEWRAEAAFAMHSRSIVAAAVARMRNQALVATLDTWQTEACKQRKVTCSGCMTEMNDASLLVSAMCNSDKADTCSWPTSDGHDRAH